MRSDSVRLRVLLQFGEGGTRCQRSINFRRVVSSRGHSGCRDGVNGVPHCRWRGSFARFSAQKHYWECATIFPLPPMLESFGNDFCLLIIMPGSTFQSVQSLRAFPLSSPIAWFFIHCRSPFVNFLLDSGQVRIYQSQVERGWSNWGDAHLFDDAPLKVPLKRDSERLVVV